MEAERLSPTARARMAALLPELLGEVRARRRRRHARRAAVLVLAAACYLLAWPWRRGEPPRDERPEVASAPRWTVVHDDPTILSRCEVANRDRPEWRLTDDALRAELRAAQRPDGVVRAGDRVFVSASAVDPWPGESP